MSSKRRREVRAAFDGIKAEDTLKDSTMQFLQKKRQVHERRGSGRLPVAALAACLAVFAVAVFAGLFTGYQNYNTESAYIALDINPSVGLALNRYDRVIEVYPYNAEGGKLVSGLALMHMPYEDAVNTLMETAARQGYLTEDGLVSLSVQTEDPLREDSLYGKLRLDADVFVALQPVEAKAEVLRVDSEVKQHAHAQGLSPARYLAFLELQEVDPEATVEECRGHSLGEIREQTRRHMGHGSGDEEEPAADEWFNNGMGRGHGHRGGHS